MDAIPAVAQAGHRRGHRALHPLHRPRVGRHRQAGAAGRARDPRRADGAAGGGGPVRPLPHAVAAGPARRGRAPRRHPRHHRARHRRQCLDGRARLPASRPGRPARVAGRPARLLDPRRGPRPLRLRARRAGRRRRERLLPHALGLLRHDGDGDRHRRRGGLAHRGRQAAAAEPRAARGLAGRGGGRRRGRLVGDDLHRVGRGRVRGRQDRARLGRHGRVLPGRALPRRRWRASCRPRPPRRR